MFSLTIQDNHLNCRKQLRESSQLPEVLQKVRYRKNQTEKAYRTVHDPPLSGPSLLMRPSAFSLARCFSMALGVIPMTSASLRAE